jgi:predicted enzyme related to lactoylglutathione lyase
MPNPVVHFEVLGKDAAALQNFYASAFGWELERAMPEYALVGAADGGIAGGIGAAPGGDSHVTFYVQVEDLEGALRHVESLGGKRLMEPTEVPGGPTIALFADPEGHVIGLVNG